MTQELRYAARAIRKNPGFATMAILSLAVGIGANAALFSLVDALLLRSLPVPAPDRLVAMTRIDPVSKRRPVDADALDRLTAGTAIFAGVTASVPVPDAAVAIDGTDEPARTVARVTPPFLRVLGVTPLMGPAEVPGPAAILSDRYYRARFGLNAPVLARTLTVNGQPYPIAAVAPAGFFGISLDASVDVWIVPPQSVAAVDAIARLQPGVSVAAAWSAADTLLRRMDAEAAAASSPEPRLEMTPAGRGLSMLREPYRAPLLALMALVAVIFLITCANVGNLLALRNAGRVHELTLRAALGAGRVRLMKQLLAEAMVLTALGTAGAWIIARWGVSLLLSTLPVSTIPEQLRFQTDARMLMFLAAVALASALLSALVPARRATRIDLAAALKTSATGAGGRRLANGGRWLLIGQIALSIVLLTSASLFVRTVQNVTRFDLGFDPHNLLQVELSRRDRSRGNEVRAVQERLFAAVAAVPGVQAVTAFNAPAFGDYFVGVPMPEEPFGGSVGPDFFQVMRIPLLRGRLPGAADVTSAQAVAVVSETYEREILGGDGLGKRIQNGPFNVEVVGIVGDARLANVRWKTAMLYRVGLREPWMMNALEVRTSVSPAVVVPAVEAAVRGVVPGLLLSVRTMDDVIRKSIARERLVAMTSACFAILGLIMAAVGIFGVAAFSVSERTSELGLRLAIGARPWDIIRDALRDSARLAVAGVALGAASSFALARLAEASVSGLLFGLEPGDWASIAIAAMLMAVVFVAACLVPAIRAVRVDPLTALRST